MTPAPGCGRCSCGPTSHRLPGHQRSREIVLADITAISHIHGLEGYHIRATHRDTFYPLRYDNLNVVETLGPNSRITFPYRNIERLRDRPESTWAIDARITFAYHLFPNAMVAGDPTVIDKTSSPGASCSTGATFDPIAPVPWIPRRKSAS